MKTYTAIVERCLDTGFYVGFIPGFPGAHSQAETLDELQKNLREVVEMLLENKNLTELWESNLSCGTGQIPPPLTRLPPFEKGGLGGIPC